MPIPRHDIPINGKKALTAGTTDLRPSCSLQIISESVLPARFHKYLSYPCHLGDTLLALIGASIPNKMGDVKGHKYLIQFRPE